MSSICVAVKSRTPFRALASPVWELPLYFFSQGEDRAPLFGATPRQSPDSSSVTKRFVIGCVVSRALDPRRPFARAPWCVWVSVAGQLPFSEQREIRDTVKGKTNRRFVHEKKRKVLFLLPSIWLCIPSSRPGGYPEVARWSRGIRISHHRK
jgi:hypothetical protein